MSFQKTNVLFYEYHFVLKKFLYYIKKILKNWFKISLDHTLVFPHYLLKLSYSLMGDRVVSIECRKTKPR